MVRSRYALRRFLKTETGSAAVLLAATIAALVRVNVDESSYATVWQTEMSVRLGGSTVTMDLRGVINSGLRTLFFFVIGLEARRELDLGDLRERSRARSGVRYGPVYFTIGVASWLALLQSGVDPIVVGLAAGLATYAAAASRPDLERATDLFRGFREQPTPALARSVRVGVQAAVSPNERLQQLYHPWSSYVIVPLFALANAGIPIDTGFLSDAYRSPITLGIVIGFVVGKPIGVVITCWLGNWLTRGRLTPPVGWGAATGVGTLAGIGFTISLLVASHAFDGADLEAAKLGILTAALLAALLSWLLFLAMSWLPERLRTRALLGDSDVIVDLADPVDPDRDHIRGPHESPVTLLEYGDFECPYCGQAEPTVRELLSDVGDLRYVWRHLPSPTSTRTRRWPRTPPRRRRTRTPSGRCTTSCCNARPS